MKKLMISKFLGGAALAICAAASQAGAIHDAALFTGNSLAANDNGSTGLVKPAPPKFAKPVKLWQHCGVDDQASV